MKDYLNYISHPKEPTVDNKKDFVTMMKIYLSNRYCLKKLVLKTS